MIVTDLPISVFDSPICAIDTETNGLDHRVARPFVLQYWSSTEEYLIPLSNEVPTNVYGLLSSPYIQKIFHHAPFDLRMLQYNLGVTVNNVGCTKLLAKIIDPVKEVWKSHSLANLLEIELGIQLDKAMEVRVSDWTILTDRQIEYAMNDVRYLVQLYDKLYGMLNYEKKLKYEYVLSYMQKQIDLDCAKYNLTGMYGY